MVFVLFHPQIRSSETSEDDGMPILSRNIIDAGRVRRTGARGPARHHCRQAFANERVTAVAPVFSYQPCTAGRGPMS